MLRMVVLVSLALAGMSLSACASSVPRLHAPNSVEVYCGDRATVATAIESIVASSGEVTQDTGVPSTARIRTSIKHDGGIIAHWNDQLLYAPRVAKRLGESGDYVTIGDVAISDIPTKTDSRPIFLTVKTPAGPRTLGLRAYDIQDVCNQGKLSS